MLEKLRYIFTPKDNRKIAGLMVMIIIGAFFELLGVTAFLPLVEVIMDASVIETSRSLSLAYDILGKPDVTHFIAILALTIAVVYIVKNVYLSFLQNGILKFSYNTRMNLATKLLVTYMNEPYTFHLNKNVAELQRVLQSDADQFMLLINAALQLIAELCVCAVLGLFLFHTSHSMTVIVAGILVLCIGGYMMVVRKVSYRIGMENQNYRGKLFQWVNQSLGGIKEVKVLEREEYFTNAYKVNYKKLIKGARINELLVAIPKYSIESLCVIGILIAIVVKLFWGYQGGDTSAYITQLAAFAVAAFRLLPSVGKINAYINNITYCKPSLELIYHDLKEVEDAKGDIKNNSEYDPSLKFEDKVSIMDITYRYPNTDVDVIDKASFDIPKGKTVAFIGPSGAGKTTMADIILGLLEPQGGTIKVDSWDIYENMKSWHHMLGYIPQTIYLSDDTIRNNIAFGIDEAMIDDKAVKEALRKAQLLEFVEGLPEGLDTNVGDRGVKLSGGQRQRIGIARALYHDPEVLVLDEATSALDNETETAVMEAIDSLKGIKTMIIIAHRLTTIRNADMIYEVSKGNINIKDRKEIFED